MEDGHLRIHRLGTLKRTPPSWSTLTRVCGWSVGAFDQDTRKYGRTSWINRSDLRWARGCSRLLHFRWILVHGGSCVIISLPAIRSVVVLYMYVIKRAQIWLLSNHLKLYVTCVIQDTAPDIAIRRPRWSHSQFFRKPSDYWNKLEIKRLESGG